MSMTTLKEITEQRLHELGLGAVEAAVQGQIERTFIRDIVEGKKKSVRADKIAALANALKLDPSALARNELVRTDSAGGLKTSSAPIGFVKVTGKVAANTWMSVDDQDFGYDDEEFVPSIGGYPVEWQFGLTIEGNCLNKIAQHGDRLVCLDIIKAHMDIMPDDLVVVERSRFDGQMIERTAKRVRRSATGFELWPESNDPAHQEPIILNEVNLGESIRVMGKVLWILRKP